jgi:hypothetical protein
MTLTIELTPEEEERLRQKAARLGLDEAGYIRRIINEEATDEEDLPKTPAEAIAYWEREGVFGTFGNRPDSPEFARQLRQQASTRKWD